MSSSPCATKLVFVALVALIHQQLDRKKVRLKGKTCCKWPSAVQEGGSITGWREADYLFSADATCPDTKRIFESKDYIWNKVTVLHSLFLSTCEKRQSVKSVCIGHYVLPPASVQDEVRKVVGRLIWEREDEETAAQDQQKTLSLSEVEHSEEEVRGSICEASDTDSSESEALLWEHLKSPVGCMAPGYVSIENLPKYSGDLHDVHPVLFRCSKCKGYLCLGPKYHKTH
ncbi:telomere repeats-binding bouquet formation protein 2 isoform X1 [Girardinichthys multiradiatus]|uniref:telomere repeats-binding bouquet formation protein 2 isoform X1 n=1 Tax=Girardinichthys multiradiatus TaxID=208333 RepID=UPI001FABBFDE|nr:telomere repeats-binding bouquet formation protein 2 isoform X1 [Girardinichthys multiradiatus]